MKYDQALALLETTDAELIKSEADAVAELSNVQATVAEHEATLLEFRKTGHRLLDAVDARSFLESLTLLLFPGQVAINAASASGLRDRFFHSSRARLAGEARELYLRSHVEPLATAIQAIITHRCRGRDKWRQQVVEQTQALEKRRMLGEPLSVDESREIERLGGVLDAADSTLGQANNKLLKFRASPNVEHFEDARRIALCIDFEDAP